MLSPALPLIKAPTPYLNLRLFRATPLLHGAVPALVLKSATRLRLISASQRSAPSPTMTLLLLSPLTRSLITVSAARHLNPHGLFLPMAPSLTFLVLAQSALPMLSPAPPSRRVPTRSLKVPHRLATPTALRTVV